MRKFVILFIFSVLTSGQVCAQTVTVSNSPRPFKVVPPNAWVRQPTSTGNSRIKFVAPPGTPYAECAVIVQEYPSAKNIPQTTLDKRMADGLTISEITDHLSAIFNNVKTYSVAIANISGHPAQLASCRYSYGTPYGEIWASGIFVTTATTPGLIWTVSCGAIGQNLNEAQKGYSYWQLEILKFYTNIRIQ